MKAKLSSKHFLTLILIVIFVSPQSFAAVKSTAIGKDGRIRTYNYQPNTVYEYTGFLKYASRIELDPDEEILSITMGDPTGWQINPVGSTLFLKPVEVDATTNMSIITSKRNYYFEMYSKEASGIDDPEVAFATSFNYPDSGGVNGTSGQDFIDLSDENQVSSYVPDLSKSTSGINLNYTMSGSKRISPIETFDDGEFTYFKFKDINADYPAIFEVLPDGNESLINYRISKEGYVVVEKVTSQFTLRFGNEIVCVFNENTPLERVGKNKKDENKSFLGVF